jgi:hypothetical protein
MGDQELAELAGKEVVVDTSTAYIYLGVLKAVGRDFLTLENVDVHDSSEGGSTKEIYVLEARKFGIRSNRKAAQVRLSLVVSVSLLADVVPY